MLFKSLFNKREFILYGAGNGYRETYFIIKRKFPKAKILGAVITSVDKEKNYPHFLLGDENYLQINSNVVLSLGNPNVRFVVGNRLIEKGINFPIIIDPSVEIDKTNYLGKGVVISPGAIFTLNAQIDNFCWICAGVIFGHDSKLGQGSVLFPGSIISGEVSIGQRTMVGAGARILPSLTIGDDVKIGAGAVVVRNVDHGKTVVGIPAR